MKGSWRQSLVPSSASASQGSGCYTVYIVYTSLQSGVYNTQLCSLGLSVLRCLLFTVESEHNRQQTITQLRYWLSSLLTFGRCFNKKIVGENISHFREDTDWRERMMSVEASVRRGQILSFSLVWLGYFVTYLLRKPLGVVKTDIAADLELSKASLGWCDTALVLPYAAVQIFLPSITDR